MSYESRSNEKKLNAMKLKILRAEQENLKTRERTNEAMVDLLRKIIMDEDSKKY